MTDITISTTSTDQPQLRDAFEQIRPEMAALAANDLLQINIDPVVAVGTVRGSLSRILSYREQLVSDAPKLDLSNLDRLGIYALALLQAQTAYSIATTPPAVLTALSEEVTKLHELLYSDASALAKRGLLNGAPLADLKGPTGYRNVAMDVLGLALLLRQNWDKISTKTCVTMAELDRAEVVGQQLVDAVGAREQNPAKIAQVTLERQQAFTLFMNAYDQVRRAIHFIRWDHEDADNIAPSLYSGRTSSRRKATSEADKQATAQATSLPIAAAPTPATTAPVLPAAAKPAVGLPGADPFAS